MFRSGGFLSVPAPQLAFQVAPGLFFLEGRPLVVLSLAAGQADLHLGPPITDKVNPQGDERNPLFPGFADQPSYFTPVEQEFARPQGVRGHMGVEVIGRDMDIVKEDLAVLDPGVPVPDVGPAGAQGLDLAPGQDQARLQGFVDMVLVKGLLVLANDLFPHDLSPPRR